MALRDYTEFAREPLRLPIGGTVYTVPPIGAQRGLRLQLVKEQSLRVGRAILAGEPLPTDLQGLEDQSEHDLYRDVLGTLYAPDEG